MKKISLKYGLLLVGMVGLLSAACEEAEQEVDLIQRTVGRGAILRTINVISNELPMGAADAEFSVELEVQDQESGSLVNTIEVFIGFLDNTDDVGPGTNVDQALFTTISNSEFTPGEFGLPRTTYSVSLPEMLAHVGRTESDIADGDQFEVRFELVLNDGRRFTDVDNSGNITGVFFSSPFLYTPTVTN